MTMADLPPLRCIEIAALKQMSLPVTRIRTEEDVEAWRHTRGYHDFGLFLRRLSQSVYGHDLPYEAGTASEAVQGTLSLLDTLDSWIDEIPPLPTPQRFGNLAFRTWGKRLEDSAPHLLATMLPDHMHETVEVVLPYLMTSFGSFVRMDYGTGHEASFGLFLCALTLVRYYNPSAEEERYLALVIFERYLRLCWRLQDIYQLEPAGSHGVWGLDDYNFISYILGSGQLRGHPDVPVHVVLQKKPLPPRNLYYMSINRINEVKRGPFHEHSSQLHSIAVGVRTWDKVNSGLFRMYEAEVLGKRVVVQHLHLGGLIAWEPEVNDDLGAPPSSYMVNKAALSKPSSSAPPGVPPEPNAPWAASMTPTSPHPEKTEG